MSETKHTPLPWEVVYVHGWPLGIGRRMRDGVLNAFRMIGNTMGRRTKEKDKATCEANAQLIVTSVNARRNVEELVEMLKAAQELREPIPTRPKDWIAILTKTREVELALAGKIDGCNVDLEAHERDMERRSNCGVE